MPSSAVHLTAAASAADTLGITDLPQFYLGCIAPDAVNIGGFAPKDIRYASHLRSRDYGEWKRNIADFRMANDSGSDFMKGVLFHLYTDIAWDEVVQPKLFAEFKRLDIPDEDFTRRKWLELDGFDAMLMRRDSYPLIISELRRAVPEPVTTVSAEQLTVWRDEVADALPPDTKPIFLSDEHLVLAMGRAVALMNGAE